MTAIMAKVLRFWRPASGGDGDAADGDVDQVRKPHDAPLAAARSRCQTRPAVRCGCAPVPGGCQGSVPGSGTRVGVSWRSVSFRKNPGRVYRHAIIAAIPIRSDTAPITKTPPICQ